MRPLIWCPAAALVLAIAWLTGGRTIVQFLDRLHTVRIANLPVTPLVYDIGNLRIGEISMTTTGLDNNRFDMQVTTNAQNRMVLSKAGSSFVLGPRTSPPDPAGRPDISLIPDPGDHLEFTVDRSVAAWLDYRILSNRYWSRNLYYRLIWKKVSGEQLTMLWRHQQSYSGTYGWDTGGMLFNFATGLLSVDLR